MHLAAPAVVIYAGVVYASFVHSVTGYIHIITCSYFQSDGSPIGMWILNDYDFSFLTKATNTVWTLSLTSSLSLSLSLSLLRVTSNETKDKSVT